MQSFDNPFAQVLGDCDSFWHFSLSQILNHSQLAVKTSSIQTKPAYAGCPQTVSESAKADFVCVAANSFALGLLNLAQDLSYPTMIFSSEMRYISGVINQFDVWCDGE
jgi:hypothetical protein